MNYRFVVAYMLAIFITLVPAVSHRVRNHETLPTLPLEPNHHKRLNPRSAMIRAYPEPPPSSQSLYVGFHPSSHLQIVDHASPQKEVKSQDSPKTPLFQNHKDHSSGGHKQERLRKNEHRLKQEQPQSRKESQKQQVPHKNEMPQRHQHPPKPESPLSSGKNFKLHVNPLARPNEEIELNAFPPKTNAHGVKFALTPPTSPRMKHQSSPNEGPPHTEGSSEEVKVQIPGADQKSSPPKTTLARASTFHDGYGRLKRMIKKYPTTMTATGVTAGTGLSAAGLYTNNPQLLLGGSITTCAFVGCQAVIEWYKGMKRTHKEKAERQKVQPSFRWSKKKPKSKNGSKPNSRAGNQASSSTLAGHAFSTFF